MHHRYVEERLDLAERAASDLGVVLNRLSIGEALSYERWTFARHMVRVFSFLFVVGLLLYGVYRAGCTPGGLLNPPKDGQCTTNDLNSHMVLMQIGVPTVIVVCVFWLQSARKGENIARCSRPLYRLLDLLCASAIVAGANTGRYTEAVRLSKKVSELRLPLRNFARDAASEFRSRQVLREELIEHLDRVDTTFAEAADQLVADREAAARRLAALASTAANSIAAGKFASVLPEGDLAAKAVLEPDRLDGRRLGRACLWAVLAVIVSSALLSPLGAPVELLLPLATLAFIVLVYVLLAFWYGLGEATRLTKSIASFFSSTPQL
ncbi:hypothetical protein [Streptomyces sp. NRRL F-5122]|uniref:hypothetical protein n=1 Tax=Streptomyces sp. NRRL F-5122 TaxID=1609098 RepID=UPI00131CAF17|nr:hypothetical protein [Streptomyces sp. NRRL F-5122]